MKKTIFIRLLFSSFFISYASGAYAQSQCIPMPTSSSSWPTSMTRSYNKLGWVINGTTYRDATSSRMVIPNGTQDPAFGVNDYNQDPNFIGSNFVASPVPGAKIIRVGRRIDNNSLTTLENSSAAFVKIQIPISTSQYKYRVRYIGITQSQNENIDNTNYWSINYRDYNGFPRTPEVPENNNPGFGFFSKYNFNSSVNHVSAIPTTIGMDEFGVHVPNSNIGTPISFTKKTNIHYGVNDSKWFRHNPSNLNYFDSNVMNYIYPIGASTYRRMTNWVTRDLDYSEFVNLGNTSAELTLLAHSSLNADSNRHAYAYYIIECLPSPTWQASNIAPFTIPNVTTCETNPCHLAQIDLPKPSYIPSTAVNSSDEVKLNWLSLPGIVSNPDKTFANNLASARVSIKYTASNYIEVQNNSISVSNYDLQNNSRLNIGLCPGNASSGPDTNGYHTFDIRVVYKTLRQTFTKDFTYKIKFYVPDVQPCPVISLNGQTSFSFCGTSSNYPTLSFNIPQCYINKNATYKLTYNADPSNATPTNVALTGPLTVVGNTLTYTYNPAHFPANPGLCLKAIRLQATYTNTSTNCENNTVFPPTVTYSAPFLLEDYSKTYGQAFIHSIVDLCLGGNIKIHFNSVIVGHCGTASNINYTIVNAANQQLFAPISIASFGNLNNLLIDLPHDPATFTLNNGNNPISILLNFTINGCNVSLPLGLGNISLKTSAIAGNITPNNPCTPTEIITAPGSAIPFSGNGTFQWQIQNSSGAWVTIQTTNTNPPANLAMTTISSYAIANGIPQPWVIRRVAFQTQECQNDNASNTITILNPNVIPTFNIPPTCQNSVYQLPASSTNTIPVQGTWSLNGVPVTHINTTTPGTFTYTFNANPNNCAYPAEVTITVTPATPASFTLPNVLCKGDTFTLPVPDNNNQGVWKLNNVTVTTVNTTNTGNFQYIFTPNNICIANYTYNVTIHDKATFNLNTTYCKNTTAIALPNTSVNGIEGTWKHNGVTITTIQTNTIGQFTYIFTPNNTQNTCAIYNHIVNIVDSAVQFSLPNAICSGNVAPVLPTTSNNGVTGTWNPATVNNTASATYIFTPSNTCSQPYTYNLTVNPQPCTITINWGSDVSCQVAFTPVDEEGPRKDDDFYNIADGPCIRVCNNSTNEYSLNGPTGTISNTDWNITGGFVNSSSNTHCNITWNGNSTVCMIQGTITFTNGSTLTINRCVEKLPNPKADFSLFPYDAQQLEYNVCLYQTVFIENHSTSNNGHDDLYYSWYLNGQLVSTQFEPTLTFDQEGVYELALVVTNGCSCSDIIYKKIIVSDKASEIVCTGVACENQSFNYTINNFDPNCEQVNVEGGDLTYDDNNGNITVNWNQVDQDGFGYIYVKSNCSPCITSLKVPVVTTIGHIKGDTVMCPNSQGTYTLPQWPTTDFNWTLDDPNNTGASLAYSIQRNEIVVNAKNPGVFTLNCSYYNTLLGCSGTATYTINVKSIINFVGNETVCQGDTVTYQPTSANGAENVNYIIVGPNGFTQSGVSNPNISVAFNNPGVYTIAVNDLLSFCASTKRITVNPKPNAPTAITGENPICLTNSYEYSCPPPPTGSHASWSIIGGDFISSNIGNTVKVQFGQTGPYKIRVRYVGESCASDYVEKTLNVVVPSNPLPPIIPANVCTNSTTNLSIPLVPGEEYFWTITPSNMGSVMFIQNNTTNNTNNVSINWHNTPGTVFVKLEIKKCGVTTTFTSSPITINGIPTLSINAPDTICAGVPFTASINTPAGTTIDGIIWDFGDNSSTNPHTYRDPITADTVYTIKATVTYINGCVQNVTLSPKTITVKPTPIVALSPSVSPIPYSNVPSSQLAVSIQNAPGLTPIISWYKNGVLVTGQTNNVLTIQNPGNNSDTYYARVCYTNGCCSNTQVIMVYNPTNTGTPCNNVINTTATANVCTTFDSNGNRFITFNHPTFTPEPNTQYWTDFHNSLDPSVFANSPNQLILGISKPGVYSATSIGQYSITQNPCLRKHKITYTVPYIPNFNHEVICNNANNTYTINLTNTSAIYTAIGTASVTTTYSLDGIIWQNSPSFTNVAPGDRTIHIKLAHTNPIYPACTYNKALTLPNTPNANFNIIGACQNRPIQFVPTQPHQNGNTYLWTFGYASASNTTQSPFFVYPEKGDFLVTLTVTNSLGCTHSIPRSLSVKENNMKGKLIKEPGLVCPNENLVIKFVRDAGSQIPSSYQWFLNSSTTPFATTSDPQLTTNQAGLYSVTLVTADGCTDTATHPILFLPLMPPPAPTVNGTPVVCQGGNATLSVPQGYYKWLLNGSPLPQYDGLHSISHTLNTAGTYTFTVIPHIKNSNNQYCAGTPATYTVQVTPAPTTPVIVITSFICEPTYKVELAIANPQPNVSYFWSNGATGNSTTLTHDGPIQVRAEAGGCVAKSQIDLPIDIQKLQWIFHNGCYTICNTDRIQQPYLIGPYGDYNPWQWNLNGNALTSGNFTINPQDANLSGAYTLDLTVTHPDFPLVQCAKTLGTANIVHENCDDCDLNIKEITIDCFKNEATGTYHYLIDMQIYSNVNYSLLFSELNNLGTITPATTSLASGTLNQVQLIFTPFDPNLLSINLYIQGFFANRKCILNIPLALPGFDNCNAVEPRQKMTEKEEVMIWMPNPTSTSTYLQYRFTEANAKTVMVHDVFGRKLLSLPIIDKEGKLEINMSQWEMGIYYVNIYDHNLQLLKTDKILKN